MRALGRGAGTGNPASSTDKVTPDESCWLARSRGSVMVNKLRESMGLPAIVSAFLLP